MTRLFADTDPKAEEVLLRIHREMPFGQKMESIRQMNMALRSLALQGLLEQYPGASEEELQRRLMDRILGPELAEKVYGPLPHPDEESDGWSDHRIAAGRRGTESARSKILRRRVYRQQHTRDYSDNLRCGCDCRTEIGAR
jgi:hypothetical protein